MTDDPNRLGSVASSTSDEGVWTRADALVALVLMLATLSMLNVVLNTRLVTLMPSSGRVFARAGGLSFAYLIEIVAIWLLARRHGVVMVQAVGLRPLFRSSKTAAISTVAVLVLLVVTRGISTVYSMITEALKWQPTFRWSTDLTQVFGHGRAGLILTIALVVLVGPLVEEMAFRGVAQSALKTRWGAWPSILATSVLFAVYHFDPWMFLPTFVLGLGLGWLTENRRGLWPAVALHVLYNGITVVAVFWLAAQ